MEANRVYEVNYNGRRYGLVFSGDRFGVCANGAGRVKYMRVKSEIYHGYFPWLYKTMLKANSAADIVENLCICDKIQTMCRECVIVCEHVLKYGKTPR